MNNLLFMDAEMVPAWEKIPDELVPFYEKRFSRSLDEKTQEFTMIPRDEIIQMHYMDNAALLAEFGKVVSISVGLLKGSEFLLRSYYGDDEKLVLDQFAAMLNARKCEQLAGHGIMEFDGPYLMRRMIVNRIVLPKVLQIMGVKPWNAPFLDTMDMWKATEFKHMVSLDLLCQTLGVPSPKGELQGSDVGKLYYESALPWERKEALEKIARYNAGDVLANARCYAALKGFDKITDDQVKILEPNVFPS